tara:strand:+ start:729 stop:1541 length:813 start_codon:yes stop_codon:yes gene_type:complete
MGRVDLKDFHKAFDFILNKVKKGENFAFTRFSDGELFMLQNKHLLLAPDHYITGDVAGPNTYTAEEQKEFDPTQHQFYRDKLMDSFLHNEEGYYKGICTATDGHVGKENFEWMIETHGGDHENLTFANLLINANYRRFIEEMVPVLAQREILYVVNEAANVQRLPLKVHKTFEIGTNCMINDYNIVEEVKEYIADKNITNHVVLCSAASLSNYIIHECYATNNQNTFLDIGSCLNPLLNLEGWKFTRGYLTSYWLNTQNSFGTQVDLWKS